MHSIQIRQSNPDDLPHLRDIWERVFGGEDGELFFERYYRPERCIVADVEGRIAAMGFLLPFGKLVFEEKMLPCAMIYALATTSENRGLGLASKIVEELVHSASATGFPVTVLCPTTDDLFQFYKKISSFREFFYVSETVLEGVTAFQRSGASLSGIRSEEYLRIRERILAKTPHIQMDIEAIRYQEKLSELYNGGLYKAESGGTEACLAIERVSDSEILVKELLAEGFINEIINAVALMFPADKYVVRMPLSEKNKKKCTKRFGMLNAPDYIIEESGLRNTFPWYGFAFD